MPIERVDDTVEVEEDFKEEGSTYNFRELMDHIYVERDLILTIPSDQVDLLKNGLIIRKAKDNAKQKSAGLIPDGDVLSFLVYASKDAKGEEVEGIKDVRVKLGPKKSVTILDMRKPNDEF